MYYCFPAGDRAERTGFLGLLSLDDANSPERLPADADALNDRELHIVYVRSAHVAELDPLRFFVDTIDEVNLDRWPALLTMPGILDFGQTVLRSSDRVIWRRDATELAAPLVRLFGFHNLIALNRRWRWGRRRRERDGVARQLSRFCRAIDDITHQIRRRRGRGRIALGHRIALDRSGWRRRWYLSWRISGVRHRVDSRQSTR